MSSERENAAEESGASKTVEQQWPVTVRLRHPVEFGKECIESLEFRRGRMGDLDGMSVEGCPTVTQLLLIASRMCNKPVAALKLLHDEDGAEVMGIALSFFARSLPGGGTL